MGLEHEAYLGDGLYASHDPAVDMFWLRAPRMGGNHVVGMEAQVLRMFLGYVCQRGHAEELERALNQHRGGGR
jgi:hypothetical protein